MTPKSLLARAVAAGKLAHRQGEQDGWSDGWHTQVSATESLRVLRDSTADAAKSTAKTATTQEGWRRIARGAGKVAGGAAMMAGGVAQGVMSAPAGSECSHVSDPWNANTNDPRTDRIVGLYYDHTGAPIDCLGNPLYED